MKKLFFIISLLLISNTAFAISLGDLKKTLENATEEIKKEIETPKKQNIEKQKSEEIKKEIETPKKQNIEKQKSEEISSKKQEIKSDPILDKQYKFCGIDNSYSFDSAGLINFKYSESRKQPGYYLYTNYIISQSEIQVKGYFAKNDQIIEGSDIKKSKIQFDDKNNLYYVITDPRDEYRTYYDFSDDEVIKYESRYLRRMGSGNTWEIHKSFTINCFTENDKVVNNLFNYFNKTKNIDTYFTDNSIDINFKYCAIGSSEDFAYFNLENEKNKFFLEEYKEAKPIAKQNRIKTLKLKKVDNNNYIFDSSNWYGTDLVLDLNTRNILLFETGYDKKKSKIAEFSCLNDQEALEKENQEKKIVLAYEESLKKQNEKPKFVNLSSLFDINLLDKLENYKTSKIRGELVKNSHYKRMYNLEVNENKYEVIPPSPNNNFIYYTVSTIESGKQKFIYGIEASSKSMGYAQCTTTLNSIRPALEQKYGVKISPEYIYTEIFDVDMPLVGKNKRLIPDSRIRIYNFCREDNGVLRLGIYVLLEEQAILGLLNYSADTNKVDTKF